MKNMMLRLSILAFVIISILFIFFIGFKLNVTPHLQSEMDRWVGIATVCTAISSAIIGFVSVWVMFDQKKMQQELLQYQKMEHQPKFIIKSVKHPGRDESGDSTYEEIKIHNVGNQSILIKDVTVGAYVTWDYEYKLDRFLDRIHFHDYFSSSSQVASDEAIYIATSDHEKRNFAKYKALEDYAFNLPNGAPEMLFSKDILVKIQYIDLYNEAQTKYFLNGYPIEEETYQKHTATTCERWTSIHTFDKWSYKNKYHPSKN